MTFAIQGGNASAAAEQTVQHDTFTILEFASDALGVGDWVCFVRRDGHACGDCLNASYPAHGGLITVEKRQNVRLQADVDGTDSATYSLCMATSGTFTNRPTLQDYTHFENVLIRVVHAPPSAPPAPPPRRRRRRRRPAAGDAAAAAAAPPRRRSLLQLRRCLRLSRPPGRGPARSNSTQCVVTKDDRSLVPAAPARRLSEAGGCDHQNMSITYPFDGPCPRLATQAQCQAWSAASGRSMQTLSVPFLPGGCYVRTETWALSNSYFNTYSQGAIHEVALRVCLSGSCVPPPPAPSPPPPPPQPPPPLVCDHTNLVIMNVWWAYCTLHPTMQDCQSYAAHTGRDMYYSNDNRYPECYVIGGASATVWWNTSPQIPQGGHRPK